MNVYILPGVGYVPKFAQIPVKLDHFDKINVFNIGKKKKNDATIFVIVKILFDQPFVNKPFLIDNELAGEQVHHFLFK